MIEQVKCPNCREYFDPRDAVLNLEGTACCPHCGYSADYLYGK